MALRSPDMDKYREHEEYLARVVSVREDHVVVNVDYEYNIPLTHCSTYEKILGWVQQLAEKTWMSTEILSRFIVVACGANKLKVPHA